MKGNEKNLLNAQETLYDISWAFSLLWLLYPHHCRKGGAGCQRTSNMSKKELVR